MSAISPQETQTSCAWDNVSQTAIPPSSQSLTHSTNANTEHQNIKQLKPTEANNDNI